MKRLLFICLFFIVLYSIYYDLTFGTLPTHHTSALEDTKEEVIEQSSPEDAEASYQQVIVEPGHTVLSIVEQLHQGPVPASIQEIVYDFKQLNKGLQPENIQIGESYLFPLYP